MSAKTPPFPPYPKYDPSTGVFRNLQGRSLGSATLNGYRTVHFQGRNVLAHRLAFYLMTGRWPENDMDHINGDRTDNRWSNLREATRQQNLFNRKSNQNRTLPKNVQLHQKSGRFRVRMKIEGRERSFGYFTDLEAAEFVASLVQERFHKEWAPNYGT